MPARIGIDMVDVDTVRDALARHPDRYLVRVFTDREVADCTRATGVDPARLAGRFAAKEAVMKVLRPTATDAVPWNAIGVGSDASGAPTVELGTAARALAARASLGALSLSITHAGNTAMAVATAETERAA